MIASHHQLKSKIKLSPKKDIPAITVQLMSDRWNSVWRLNNTRIIWTPEARIHSWPTAAHRKACSEAYPTGLNRRPALSCNRWFYSCLRIRWLFSAFFVALFDRACVSVRVVTVELAVCDSHSTLNQGQSEPPKGVIRSVCVEIKVSVIKDS